MSCQPLFEKRSSSAWSYPIPSRSSCLSLRWNTWKTSIYSFNSSSKIKTRCCCQTDEYIAFLRKSVSDTLSIDFRSWSEGFFFPFRQRRQTVEAVVTRIQEVWKACVWVYCAIGWLCFALQVKQFRWSGWGWREMEQDQRQDEEILRLDREGQMKNWRGMFVCVCALVWECVCVHLCESVCVCALVWVCVCVCVCARVWERESVCWCGCVSGRGCQPVFTSLV